jgi:hypothetical protein
MHREHRVWHSPNLGWEMGVAIFGHFGPPSLFFPTSLGDEWEHEGQGMIRTLSPLIDAGRMKVFCVRSVTAEGLFNKQAHPFHRSWVLRCYDAYIRQEVIPFIHHHCQGLPPVAVMGASLGAFHAAANQEAGETFRLMFAAMLVERGRARQVLAPRSTPEFADHDDQGLVEESASLKIFQQGRQRLIKSWQH